MEKVYMSEKELTKMPLYYKIKTTEATILEYSKKEIIKYFYSTSDNKVYTLEEIERQEEDLKLIKEFLLFNKIMIVHSEIKGVFLEKGYSTNLNQYLEDKSCNFQNLILILQNIGVVLETLKNICQKEGKLKNFFIGDIHEANILIDSITKKIQFCDLDSCKIGDNLPFRTKYIRFYNMRQFINSHLSFKYPANNLEYIPNHNTDLYCYNAMILNLLFHIDIRFLSFTDFCKEIYQLREQGLPKPLFQTFLNLYNTIDNENPYHYLDTIPESFERKLKL